MISLASRLNDTVILIKLISNKSKLNNTKITMLDNIGFSFRKQITIFDHERTRKKTTHAEIDVAIVAIKMRTPLTTIRATVTTQRLRERNCFFLRQVYEKRKIKKKKKHTSPYPRQTFQSCLPKKRFRFIVPYITSERLTSNDFNGIVRRTRGT